MATSLPRKSPAAIESEQIPKEHEIGLGFCYRAL